MFDLYSSNLLRYIGATTQAVVATFVTLTYLGFLLYCGKKEKLRTILCTRKH